MFTLERTFKEGSACYHATNRNGARIATITIKDSSYKNYSIVPTIIKVWGGEAGIDFILNNLVAKLKGPMVAVGFNRHLLAYGFLNDGEYRLVWTLEN